ncbi:MAG: hypothetical protein JSV01_04695 [Desulfobacterales bacterium]|nr:MAG: hypothetical protein JSV01_04695 [Desulfobacterales bacterium]
MPNSLLSSHFALERIPFPTSIITMTTEKYQNNILKIPGSLLQVMFGGKELYDFWICWLTPRRLDCAHRNQDVDNAPTFAVQTFPTNPGGQGVADQSWEVSA